MSAADDVIRAADEVCARAMVTLAKAQMILHDHTTRHPLVAVSPDGDTGSETEKQGRVS